VEEDGGVLRHARTCWLLKHRTGSELGSRTLTGESVATKVCASQSLGLASDGMHQLFGRE
jgi:hypothetical protein